MKSTTAEQVIQEWMERDLSADAQVGKLTPAYEVDKLLEQMTEIIRSGKHPILTGEPGVGKSAAISELVRISHLGKGLPELRNGRVLQFSLRRRLASLKKPEQLRKEFQRLLNALQTLKEPIIPYLRDMHLAWDFSLEPLLQAFAFRLQRPILGEGQQPSIEAMMECSPELEQDYVMLKVSEPDLNKAKRILQQWSRDQRKSNQGRLSPEATEEALDLSHRFLSRSRLPRKVLDLLGQVLSLTPDEQTVEASDVIDRFCRNHHVPRVLIDPEMPLNLAEVDREFRAGVLGQWQAVDAVVRMIGLIKAGLSDVRRPFGVFLFAGPTGVGKTYLAQLLAEYLFGSRDRLIRFNMADYQGPNADEVLFGNSDSYRLQHQRGLLTQRILGHPFAVLLLDEFEKTSPRVLDRFLQLIDEGCFINGTGETISCRSMILIATTNAGTQVYRSQPFGFSAPRELEALQQQVDQSLLEHFRFELLNRFDEVVHFHPLGQDVIRDIARRELEQLTHRTGLQRRKLTLAVEPELLNWLTEQGYHTDYGARFLRRVIEREVSTALAKSIVDHNPAPGSELRLSLVEGKVRVDSHSPQEKPTWNDNGHGVFRIPPPDASNATALV